MVFPENSISFFRPQPATKSTKKIKNIVLENVENELRVFIMFLFLRICFRFLFHRKGAESAKKRYFSFSVERTAKEKNQSVRDIFCYKCPQGLLLIVFRPLNGKQ